MLIKMINTSVLWLNAFPPKGSVSEMMCPRFIVIGVPFGLTITNIASGHSGHMDRHKKNLILPTCKKGELSVPSVWA
jgi:hypothetical protein